MSKNAKTPKWIIVTLAIIYIILFAMFKLVRYSNTKTNNVKETRAVISILSTAIEQYKDRYESYPKLESSTFDFGEKLSSVPVNSDYLGKRPMYIDFIQFNISVSNKNYAEVNATKIVIFDSWKTPYYYRYNSQLNTFTVISAGKDKILFSKDDIEGNY